MNSSGPDGDEPRLGGRRVGIDEALGQEDRLGGLAVLAAAGPAVHQPRPRAPVVAHAGVVRQTPAPRFRPPASGRLNPRGSSRRSRASVNGLRDAACHTASRSCHRELTAFRLTFPAAKRLRGTGMAYFGITATGRRAQGRGPAARMSRPGSRGRSAAAGPEAPIVVLIHGYKFHPDRPDADPHRSLFALRPEQDGWQIRSWPEGLGFAEDAGETGLCVGFAWPASAPHLASLLATGRNGFARVYDRAGAYGARLAELVALLQRLAPGRPVDVLAHSLGARVALAALPHLAQAPGRMILLGAAEFDARALDFLARRARPRPPDLQRHRPRQRPLRPDVRDASRRAATGASGRSALGLRAATPALARPAARPRRGHRLGQRPGHPADRARARLCHWSFYTRDGALAVYQAILRRQPGWDIAGAARRRLLRARRSRAGAGCVPRRRRGLPGLPRSISAGPAPALDPGRAAAPCSRGCTATWKWTDDRTDRALLLADAERLQDHHRAARDGPALRPPAS